MDVLRGILLVLAAAAGAAVGITVAIKVAGWLGYSILIFK